MNLGDFRRAVDEFVSDRGTHPAYVVMDRTTARSSVSIFRSLTVLPDKETKVPAGDLVIAGIPIVVIPGPPCMVAAVGTPGEEMLRP